MKIGLDPGSRTVLVKDVSTSGIGLIADNVSDQPMPQVGDVVHITFSDIIGQGTPQAKEFSFSLKATVCRTADDPGKNRTVLGCRFAKSNEQIGQYVNMKQTAHKKNKRS